MLHTEPSQSYANQSQSQSQNPLEDPLVGAFAKVCCIDLLYARVIKLISGMDLSI